MTVDEFLADLTHARKSDVLQIRSAILESDPELTESVKWNAPNFIFNGEDRITFRLQPHDRVDLILHRGAKKRSDSDLFVFEDTSGLITWAARDRGVISFAQGAALNTTLEKCLPTLNAWVRTS
jgi:hypothetical protein